MDGAGSISLGFVCPDPMLLHDVHDVVLPARLPPGPARVMSSPVELITGTLGSRLAGKFSLLSPRL